MEKRKLNKLLKKRREILNQEYAFLSDSKREKSWSRLINIDNEIKKLK